MLFSIAGFDDGGGGGGCRLAKNWKDSVLERLGVGCT